jgi:DHA1 family arabinose polymer transporter-like MFS transporter
MKKSLAALAIGTFLLGMAEFAMEGILSDVSSNMGISIPEAGRMISVYALGVCVGAIFLVGLYKYAPKKIILCLLSLIFLGALLSLTAQNFLWLLTARFISGLPHGAYYGVGTIIATRLADEKHKTSAVALMCAGMTFANLLGVPVSTFLSSTLSWRLPFAMIAVIGLLALFLAWKWIPDMKPLPNKGFKGQFDFLKHEAPWLIILATMFGNGGILAWYSYISPTLIQYGGLSARWLPVFMILAGGGMVLGNLLSGWLSDKYKPGMISALLQGIAGMILLIIFFTAQVGSLHVFLMVICCGCLFGMGTPEQLLIIQHSKGGEMLGGCCIQIAFNFGNAVGAFLGGLSVDAGFGYNSPALVGFPFVMLGFILLVMFSWKYEFHRK